MTRFLKWHLERRGSVTVALTWARTLVLPSVTCSPLLNEGFLENDDNLTGSPIRPKADWQVSGVHPSPAVQSSSLPQSLARNITAEKGQFCHFWPPLEESSSHRRTLGSLSSSAKYWISHQLCDWLSEKPKLKWTGYHIKNFSFAESTSWFGIVTRKHSYTYMQTL